MTMAFAFVDTLRQDVRYALRALRRSPGFSSVAILSLALGIGANTTIFTFVNAVLLRPLPYPGSDRLVVLREQPLGSDGTVNVHPFNFLEWRARARSFEALTLLQTPPLNVIGPNGAEQINRAQTTSELFRVFGLTPALGRMFTDEETIPGKHDVVILGAQTPGYITNLVVRAAGDPHAQAAAIRRAIHDVDRTQAASAVKTMEQYVGDSLARPRLYAVLVATFAALAVMLAAIGVYGLIAYVVTQRTHEIGIRLALGAAPGRIFQAVFRQGALLTLAGLALGLVVALMLRGVVTTLVFGVTPGDPVSYVVAAAVFAAIAFAAAAIPARRASRVDPTNALRYE